jgi:[acyl-carrier-protein] S-malonyltransferase
MSKTAFVFPGQASQYVGMARDLFDASDKVRRLFAKASDILGFDLQEVCFNGPMEVLTRTEHTQPAVLVHSLAVMLELEMESCRPNYCAGHSLGEYSALACAGVMTFDDAIAAVRDRSRLMKAACDSTHGTMAAAIGGDSDSLEKLISDSRAVGVLQAANYNSPGQVALSGDIAAIDFAKEKYREYGFKRMLPLQVGGAFHSPLMQYASDRMQDALSGLQFSDASCPVIPNVTAEPESDGDELRQLLVRQIMSPVKWMQSMQKMYDLGVTRFVEIGPGKVLSGLIGKTLTGVEIENVDTMSDVERFHQIARSA